MRLRHQNVRRTMACVVLVLVVGISLAANWLAPAGYAKQYREAAGAPHRTTTGWGPMRSAGTGLRAFCTERAFRSCWPRQLLCSQR